METRIERGDVGETVVGKSVCSANTKSITMSAEDKRTPFTPAYFTCLVSNLYSDIHLHIHSSE